MEHKFTSSTEKDRAATRTLESLGYAYQGGQFWKPPVGQPPAYITWDGEVVPPAGVECEALESAFRIDSGEWRLIHVLFSNDEYVFASLVRSQESRPKIFTVSEWIFRKYETPEERAAARKAKACDAIASLLMVDSPFSEDAARIYDAIASGKIPGIPALSKE